MLNIHWKDWCWSWNSNALATWCEELTHWKRLWCWEGLGAGGEGDDRGWDGWMTSPTQWISVWVSSGSWWWTGKPGVLQSMGSQRVEHDQMTELSWTASYSYHCNIYGLHYVCWDDWVRKFESILMRWMKLELIIQSEVSQKEKHQYSILTHIYGI